MGDKLYRWVRSEEQEAKSESEYLSTRATYYNGELSGIAKALEGGLEIARMLASFFFFFFFNSLLACRIYLMGRALKAENEANCNAGDTDQLSRQWEMAPPRSKIEARNWQRYLRGLGSKVTSRQALQGSSYPWEVLLGTSPRGGYFGWPVSVDGGGRGVYM